MGQKNTMQDVLLKIEQEISKQLLIDPILLDPNRSPESAVAVIFRHTQDKKFPYMLIAIPAKDFYKTTSK